MNTLNKNIQSFFVCIFIMQIFGVIRLREKESICEKTLSRLRLIFFIFSFLAFFAKVVKTPNDDLMIIYCQYIERAATIISSVLIMIEFLILRHDHGKIFQLISDIDYILKNRLKIKIDYRKNFLFNCIICLSNSALVYGIFLSTGSFIKNNYNFTSYFFFIFSISWFFSCIIETFYISLVFQIYLRYRKIKNFLNTNEENFQLKDVINEILMKTSSLFEVINDAFGISILIIAGEIITLIR